MGGMTREEIAVELSNSNAYPCEGCESVTLPALIDLIAALISRAYEEAAQVCEPYTRAEPQRCLMGDDEAVSYAMQIQRDIRALKPTTCPVCNRGGVKVGEDVNVSAVCAKHQYLVRQLRGFVLD